MAHEIGHHIQTLLGTTQKLTNKEEADNILKQK
jgi:predicted metalloprotease